MCSHSYPQGSPGKQLSLLIILTQITYSLLIASSSERKKPMIFRSRAETEVSGNEDFATMAAGPERH